MQLGWLVRVGALFATVAPLSLVLACGGGGDEPFGESTGEPGANVVDQDNLKFKPSSLSVSVGEVVTFKNGETSIHTVTINGKNESGTMKKDSEFRWTAPSAGTYKVTCDYHPQMKATITVK